MRVLLIFLIVTALAFGSGVVYNSQRQAKQAKGELSEERYLRMVAEESHEKAQSQVSALTSQLEKKEMKLKNLEARLTLAESKNGNLKSKLGQFEELKAALEKQVTDLQGRLRNSDSVAVKQLSVPGLE